MKAGCQNSALRDERLVPECRSATSGLRSSSRDQFWHRCLSLLAALLAVAVPSLMYHGHAESERSSIRSLPAWRLRWCLCSKRPTIQRQLVLLALCLLAFLRARGDRARPRGCDSTASSSPGSTAAGSGCSRTFVFCTARCCSRRGVLVVQFARGTPHSRAGELQRDGPRDVTADQSPSGSSSTLRARPLPRIAPFAAFAAARIHLPLAGPSAPHLLAAALR